MKYLLRAIPALVVAALLIVVPWLHSSRTMPVSTATTDRLEGASVSIRNTFAAQIAAIAADRAALAILVEAQRDAVIRAGWAPIVTIEAPPAPLK